MAERSRIQGALVGGLAALALALAEAALRYLPLVRDTDLTAKPVLGLLALVGYLLAAVPAGALHPLAPAAVLAAIAVLGGDLTAVLLALVLSLLAIPAARRPRLTLPPLLSIAAGLLWLAPRPVASGSPGHPPIVVVVLDTVAASATSLHGGRWPTTPHLDRLAAEGTHFTNATATAPWTVPSHASMFTGKLPSQLGCHHESPQLPASATTTAERLAAAGYRTGAFVANPWVGDFNGLTQGFAHQENHWERVRAARAFSLSGLLPARPSKGGAATVRSALRWLHTPSEQPAFAFVNLLEAHSPFHLVPDAGQFSADDVRRASERMHHIQMHGPQSLAGFPEPGEVDAARAVYAAAVHAADALLGALVAGLPPDTTLIVTSDHGEAFGEHDFYGHMVGLYQETLHVPLVLHGAAFPAGQVIDTPVSTRWIHDTVLQAAGLSEQGLPDVPEEPVLSEQWRPLQVLADFSGTASPEQLAALDHRAQRVRQGDTVLLRQDATVTRYALGADPDEQHPEPVADGDDVLLSRLPPLHELPTATPTMDRDLRAQLRSLGYLGSD